MPERCEGQGLEEGDGPHPKKVEKYLVLSELKLGFHIPHADSDQSVNFHMRNCLLEPYLTCIL